MNDQEFLSTINRKYLECFCRRGRDGFFVRYADPALPDMYCHNFLFLKKAVNSRLLLKTLNEKMDAARAAGQKYFRLELKEDPALRPEAYPSGGEIGHNGIYVLTPRRTDVESWPCPPEFSVRAMAAQSDAKALTEVQMDMAYGTEFCERRAERKTRVFISGSGCRNFLAFSGEVPAGTCELFESGSTAKLEDLCVRPEFRHRKAASALLRTLALTALDDGCKNLTLTADENDTPRELYQALGFHKAGDFWAITWTLS